MPKQATSRNAIALLLGVGVLVNYFDRVNLSIAHDALHRQYGISDIGFGYLLGAYSWTYALMQLPSGYLLDRLGVRRVMLVATLLWAVASGLAALAWTMPMLFLARYLLGVGEAPTFPANAKAIGLWFPDRQRGVATATFDAAAKLSIGISTPLLGLILLRLGLHANFATTALLSLGYAALFAAVYRDPGRGEGNRVHVQDPSQEHRVLFTTLLRERKVWGAALGAGAYNYCFYLLLTWLPFYLERGLKMTPRSAVLWSALPWLVAAASGFLVGGVMVDWVLHRGGDANLTRRTVLITGAVLGLFVLAPVFLHSATGILICLTIALSGGAILSPVSWTLPSLLGTNASSGRIGAIMNLCGQIAAITAPILTGYISDMTHSFVAAFLAAGFVLLLGIVSYVFLLGRIDRLALPAASLAGRENQ